MCGKGDEEKAQLKEGIKRVYCGRQFWHWTIFLVSIVATYTCSQLTHGFVGIDAQTQFCQQDSNSNNNQPVDPAKCNAAKACGNVLYETVFPDAASFEGPLVVTWVGHAMLVLDKLFEHVGAFKKTAIADAGGEAPMSQQMDR